MRELCLMASLIVGAGIAGAEPARKAPPRKPARPAKVTPSGVVSFGTPKITGALDVRAVATGMRRGATKLKTCYTRRLAVTPELAGSATAMFAVAPSGKVTSVAILGFPDAVVEKCVERTIARLRFARPKDRKKVEVEYPLTFEHERAAPVFMTGAGGGGTGIGTIGIGTIGTIGKGTGTGSGYGVGAGRLGTRQRTGSLDKAIIRRVIRRNLPKIVHCYEKELVTNDKLQGTVTAEFTIGGHGDVITATARGMGNVAVESCVAAAVKAMRFPRPAGGVVNVKYPFVFRPSE